MCVKIKHKNDERYTEYNKIYYEGYVTSSLDQATRVLNLKYQAYFSKTSESVYVLVYEGTDKYKVLCIRAHDRINRIQGNTIDLGEMNGLKGIHDKIYKYLDNSFKVNRQSLDTFTREHYNALIYLKDRMSQGIYFTCTRNCYFSDFKEGLHEGYPKSKTFKIMDQDLLDNIIDLRDRGLIQGYVYDDDRFNLYITDLGRHAISVLGRRYQTSKQVTEQV